VTYVFIVLGFVELQGLVLNYLIGFPFNIYFVASKHDSIIESLVEFGSMSDKYSNCEMDY
jgi:hypothetical protein